MLFRPQYTAPLLATLGLLVGSAAHAQVPIATATAGDSLSLEATVRSVLDANPAINALQEEVNQAQSRLEESRTYLRPVVEGTVSYTRIDPVVKIPLGDATFQLAPANNYDGHVTARYTVLDFGRANAAIEAARSRTLTAADQINVTRRDLAFAAAQSYYSILFAREAIRVQDAQIASLRQHQREMEKRVQGGVSTNFDVTTTQVRIAQAQDRKIDLQNQLRNQEIQLARLLHRPESEVVPVRGRFEYNPQAVDVAAALAKGAENRPEVKLAKDAEATAAAQLRVAEVGNKPTLNLVAQAGGKNGYIVPNLERVRFNTVAGAQLNIPIYDGDRNRYQRAEAQSAIKGAQSRTQDTQEQVRADVLQAVNNMQSSTARYDNSEVQITQATDALTRAQARYRYGVGSNLDVLDAETQLAQSRLSRLQAIYNYTLGQYQLRRATGEQIW
ncbi:outer membrane protein TolC [Hymenobacter luteus]|uniref:Outer membrane protein TolC n=2 Tax=Hymenobacter TaxID=89966 RepID=A0A7W9T333_9BACT|nr:MULTISPECIES: TolC family protein [Hymenobacter]MBB4602301.1 outer membrane protein TolC [Hymenobacter latericoloratus]MBB6060193.1 outer membrane protein TolC [Hymenobacter luteus]